MLKVPRDLARTFRVVLRQSLMAEAPRGPFPVVLAQAEREGLILQASQGDLSLRYRQPGDAGTGVLAFKGELLAQFEGRQADPVRLETVEPGKGRACWTDAGVPRSIEFETAKPETVPVFPALPRQFSSMPGSFLPALTQAALSTPRESVRVIGSDGKQLLIQGGFVLPWTDDLLVPRVPAFGLKELDEEEPVLVGRTTSHVAVRAGQWTFLLQIDTAGRYPNVDQVIPRPGPQATCLRVHPDDAAFLLKTVPRLPGHKDVFAPITLDLGSQAALRVQDEQGQVTEVVLSRSSVSGPPMRLCLNRRYLTRALQLTFQEMVFLSPDKPMLCRDQDRLYLCMPLEGGGVIAPSKGMLCLTSTEGEPIQTKPPLERKKDPMPPVQPNGHVPENGRANQAQPERFGIDEILTEAEAVRAQLQEASSRMARLLAALKHQRRQSRAVQAAMASLRQLHHFAP